ncbi:MAG: MmgE/PrpD family protein [Chloroflexota bacterium]|nr:MmgE/PrpD family protein [Chloroflexota bacterium]
MDDTTKLLAEYSCDLTYEDLDAATVHQVKRTLIDTVGCAMGGYLAEPAKIARKLAYSVAGNPPARVVGTQDFSSLDMASFANGCMIRYLDCNDSYFSPGGGHPSDMIAAVLAVGDAYSRSGRELLTSITLAYEIFARLSDQVVTGDLGWDQGMFSIVGATCAAGSLMGLDRDSMGNAISLALAPNLPLGVTRTGELSMWKGCATASATRAGVFAAQLAAEGMSGPAEPFQGRRGLWEQSGVTQEVTLEQFGRDGQQFLINDTTFKFYPSQIHTQAPIGLAVALRPRINLENVESISIEIYRSGVSSPETEPEKWDPQTRETADHSIPFLVAMALQDGSVTPASFAPHRIADPSLRALMSRMTMSEGAGFTEKYPQQYNCRIEVVESGGRTTEAATSYPKGHKNNPLSDHEVAEKFTSLSSAVLSEQQCSAALDILWRFEEEPDLTRLLETLVV